MAGERRAEAGPGSLSPSHTIAINIYSSLGSQNHPPLSLSKVFTLIGEQIDPAIQGAVSQAIDSHATGGDRHINSEVETTPNDPITFDNSRFTLLHVHPSINDPGGVTTSGVGKADDGTFHTFTSAVPHLSSNRTSRQKGTSYSNPFSTSSDPDNTPLKSHFGLLSSTIHQILEHIMETMHSMMQRLDALERTIAGLNELRSSSINPEEKPRHGARQPVIDQFWKVAEQKQPTVNVEIAKGTDSLRTVNHTQSNDNVVSAELDNRKKADACRQGGEAVVDLNVHQTSYPAPGKPEIPLLRNPGSRTSSAQSAHPLSHAIEMSPATTIKNQGITQVKSKSCEEVKSVKNVLSEHEMAPDRSGYSPDSVEKTQPGVSREVTTSNKPMCLTKAEKTPRGSDRGVSLGDTLPKLEVDGKAKWTTTKNSEPDPVSAVHSVGGKKTSSVDSEQSSDGENVENKQCRKQDFQAEDEATCIGAPSATARPSSDKEKASESSAASAADNSLEQKQAAEEKCAGDQCGPHAANSTPEGKNSQSKSQSTAKGHFPAHSNSTAAERVQEASFPMTSSKTQEGGKSKVSIGSPGPKESKSKGGQNSTPESESSNDSIVRAKHSGLDESPPQPVYESEASRCAAGLRSNKPLPEPDWYPPKVHTLGPNASYYICNLLPFSREFIEFNFGGVQWSPGFYWVPDSGLLPSRSYWMIDREWQPFMPCDPGRHGANLSLFTNDIKGPEQSCYQDVPVFVRKKGGEGYIYIGQHSLLPEREPVDPDTLKERVPQPVLKYWAKQLASRDRPTWVKEKVFEHFLPSFTSAGVNSQPPMSDADARKKIAKLRSKDFLEAFNRRDGDLFALRFQWEYLQCVRYDGEFYKFLFKIKFNPKLQRSAASSAIRRSSRTSGSASRPLKEDSNTTQKKILRVTAKSSGKPSAIRRDELSTRNTHSRADSPKSSEPSPSSTSLIEGAMLSKDSVTGNNKINASTTIPAAHTTPTKTTVSPSAEADRRDLIDSSESPETIVPKIVPPHLRHDQKASRLAGIPGSVSPAIASAVIKEIPELVSYPSTSTGQAISNNAESAKRVEASCIPPHLRNKRRDSLQDGTSNEAETVPTKSTALLLPRLRSKLNPPANSSNSEITEKSPTGHDYTGAASRPQSGDLLASRQEPENPGGSLLPEKTTSAPSYSLSEQRGSSSPLQQDESGSSLKLQEADTALLCDEGRTFVLSPRGSLNDNQAPQIEQKGVVFVPPHLRGVSTAELHPVTPSEDPSAAAPEDTQQSNTVAPPHFRRSNMADPEPEAKDKVHSQPEQQSADDTRVQNSIKKSPRKSSPRRAKCATAEELWKKLTHAVAHQEKRRSRIKW